MAIYKYLFNLKKLKKSNHFLSFNFLIVLMASLKVLRNVFNKKNSLGGYDLRAAVTHHDRMRELRLLHIVA